MDQVLPEVMWIDEDQGDLPAADWAICRCGARVSPIHSVREALEYLREHRPDLILLDVIVQPGGIACDERRYTGLTIWRTLDSELRSRTVVLSVVPYSEIERLFGVPESRFFWKVDLGKQLAEFENAIRAIVSASEGGGGQKREVTDA